MFSVSNTLISYSSVEHKNNRLWEQSLTVLVPRRFFYYEESGFCKKWYKKVLLRRGLRSYHLPEIKWDTPDYLVPKSYALFRERSTSQKRRGCKETCFGYGRASCRSTRSRCCKEDGVCRPLHISIDMICYDLLNVNDI